MRNQEERMMARKQDEEITNRILYVFSLSLLLLLAVMFVNRYMNSLAYYQTLAFCTVASIIFAVTGVGLMLLALVKRKKNAANLWFGRLIVLGSMSLITAAVLLIIRLFQFQSFSVLYTVLPVAAFLYMIYNIYQRDFFYQTIVVGCTAGTLYAFSRWLHFKPWQPIVHITYILAIVLLIAAILLTMYLKKHKGALGKIRLLSHGSNYKLMLLTFGLMLLTVVVVLAIGSGIAFWTMIGVFGYLFVLAVYYTIRLM